MQLRLVRVVVEEGLEHNFLTHSSWAWIVHSWRQTTIRPGFDDNSRRSPHCGRGRVKTCLKWDLHWKIYTFKYNLWTNSPLLFIFHVVTQRFASFYQWEYFSHGWHWITKFGSQKWRKRFQLLWYILEGYIFIWHIMADVLSESTTKLDKPVPSQYLSKSTEITALRWQCCLQSGIPILKFFMIKCYFVTEKRFQLLWYFGRIHICILHIMADMLSETTTKWHSNIMLNVAKCVHVSNTKMSQI